MVRIKIKGGVARYDYVMRRYLLRQILSTLVLPLMLVVTAGCVTALAAQPQRETTPAREQEQKIKKVLFIGDSMTGWMAERLNAYGQKNGFEVATIVWDGSTIKKWASSPRLASVIEAQHPDAVFISLGMNELFEANPDKALGPALSKIKEALGDTPFLWIGPPSWPGHNKGEVLNNWLARQLGQGHFFRSFSLKLPRQSSRNPHPTRIGICQWIDAVMKWVPENTELEFPATEAPASGTMSRGKTFIYKRMKEAL